MTPHIPWGAWHGLIAGNPPLDGVGEWGKLACLDKTEEQLARNIGAHPVRHRRKVLGGLGAQAATLLRTWKISERRGQVRDEEEEDGKAKSQIRARRAVLKGAGAAPHLQCWTHHVSETFARLRVRPGETTAHSCKASIPAEYGLEESACSHDGAATSVTSVEMPAPITAPMFTMMTITAPTRHPQAATATITNISSRASL
jgi:hypothetical protein